MTALEKAGPFADLPLDVEAELGRQDMTVREVLNLNLGDVIKINRSAGENVDVLIGGVLAGYGEIVVTETTTGVRITDLRRED